MGVLKKTPFSPFSPLKTVGESFETFKPGIVESVNDELLN